VCLQAREPGSGVGQPCFAHVLLRVTSTGCAPPLRMGLKRLTFCNRFWSWLLPLLCRSYAKGFAVMGLVYSGCECLIEKRRARHDKWNAPLAGCAAGGIMAAPGETPGGEGGGVWGSSDARRGVRLQERTGARCGMPALVAAPVHGICAAGATACTLMDLLTPCSQPLSTRPRADLTTRVTLLFARPSLAARHVCSGPKGYVLRLRVFCRFQLRHRPLHGASLMLGCPALGGHCITPHLGQECAGRLARLGCCGS
jgi:hypothetical protein